MNRVTRKGEVEMKLQLRRFHVRDVVFADQTAFRDGTLYICRDEFKEVLEDEAKFVEFDVELAHPGESVRILQVSDVIEPRARRDGGDFPGVLSPTVNIVGHGVTDVLSGAAVVLLDECGNNCGVTHDAAGSTIDMIGPGSEISTFGKTHNICLIPHAKEGIDFTEPDFKVAYKRAGLRAAVYLAQVCSDMEPDEIEIFELPPLAEASKGMHNLARIVYVFNMYRYYLKNEFAIYGQVYSWLPSVLMHPNEFFDGAVVNPYLNANLSSPATMDTYTIQNHPVIKELYRRHGKELCFLGVIPTVAQQEEAALESQANLTVKLAKMLGSDGLILTKATGGSPQMDVAITAIKASEFGIKSVLILDDIAARSPDGKFRTNGVVFDDDRAGAIVNTGNVSEVIDLPPVERVIGFPVPGADGALRRIRMALMGQGAQLGDSRTVEVEY